LFQLFCFIFISQSHILLHSMIGYYHRNVVCSSITLCIVALHELWVCVQGWKLYRLVPSRQLPINFFTHFCCRMYRLATKRTQRKNELPKLVHSLEYG